jgi:hypothetical protein
VERVVGRVCRIAAGGGSASAGLRHRFVALKRFALLVLGRLWQLGTP